MAGLVGVVLMTTLSESALGQERTVPKADPAGDYAWEVFRRAEDVHAGSRVALERKALLLTGGPSSPRPPERRRSVAPTRLER